MVYISFWFLLMMLTYCFVTYQGFMECEINYNYNYNRSILTIKKHTEALVFATKEIWLDVNTDKTKYMFMSGDQNAGWSHNITIDNSSFERVGEFRYFGTNLMNQNSIQKEIKSRLKSGNACYQSLQHLFSSSLLCKYIKIKIYRTVMLAFALYGCETWLLTLREEHRLKVFEKWC